MPPWHESAMYAQATAETHAITTAPCTCQPIRHSATVIAKAAPAGAPSIKSSEPRGTRSSVDQVSPASLARTQCAVALAPPSAARPRSAFSLGSASWKRRMSARKWPHESSGHRTGEKRVTQRDDCQSRKSESRFSPEVRMSKSGGGTCSDQVHICCSKSDSHTSAGCRCPAEQLAARLLIAEAISYRDVYAKQTVSTERVLCCVMSITRSISARIDAESRGRSPTTRTRTRWRWIKESSAHISLSFSEHSDISASTSSAERLKFSIENAYTVMACTPNSPHHATACSSVLYPAR
mmetsp:Transcript_14907/g.34113  ORF Transcript_14907/g.34113 Transcript_14907/m.34113 type:complete len:295 (-) Transcript_14907:313-1197(-)